MREQSVECLSSQAYADRPIALHWEGERLEIQTIVSRWRTPESIHFLVRTGDERTFELNYLEADDNWIIHLK